MVYGYEICALMWPAGFPNFPPPPVFEHPHSCPGQGFRLDTVGTRRCKSGRRSCKPALCLPPPPALGILVAFDVIEKGRIREYVSLRPPKEIVAQYSRIQLGTSKSTVKET